MAVAVPRPATLEEVLACFHAGLRYLHEGRIPRLLYKRIPGFYNTLPDDEVAYALFLLEARLSRRDCAVVIPQADRRRFRNGVNGRLKRPARAMSALCKRRTIPRFGGACSSQD